VRSARPWVSIFSAKKPVERPYGQEDLLLRAVGDPHDDGVLRERWHFVAGGRLPADAGGCEKEGERHEGLEPCAGP